jgi:protein O-mannosyl-transferase
MHPRRVNVLVALLLAAVTATAFSPAFRAGYVALDDPLYVAGNPHVPGGLTGDNLAWAFTTFLAGNWHPLTWLSLQLDATLFGTNPAGFHSTNVLLHAASAVLLYLALQALTGGRWRGALVAALFALHPLRVESVAWVSERKDVLSLLFGVAALWAYAEYARRPGAVRYLAVTLAFALSLLAKPMLVTLPFLLLVLDGWPLRRAVGSADWRRLTLEKLPLFALAAASCVVTVLAQQAGKAVGSVEVFSLSSRLANATVACATYLGMAAWPLNLAPFYPYRHAGWPVWQVGISGLILAGLSTLAVWQWQRRPYLLVGWLWYLGTWCPSSDSCRSAHRPTPTVTPTSPKSGLRSRSSGRPPTFAGSDGRGPLQLLPWSRRRCSPFLRFARRRSGTTI